MEKRSKEGHRISQSSPYQKNYFKGQSCGLPTHTVLQKRHHLFRDILIQFLEQ